MPRACPRACHPCAYLSHPFPLLTAYRLLFLSSHHSWGRSSRPSLGWRPSLRCSLRRRTRSTSGEPTVTCSSGACSICRSGELECSKGCSGVRVVGGRALTRAQLAACGVQHPAPSMLLYKHASALICPFTGPDIRALPLCLLPRASSPAPLALSRYLRKNTFFMDEMGGRSMRDLAGEKLTEPQLVQKVHAPCVSRRASGTENRLMHHCGRMHCCTIADSLLAHLLASSH